MSADDKAKEVLTTVSNMKLMEIVDLVKKMEEEFNVSAAAPAAPVIAAAALGAATAAVEEKTEFNVVLIGVKDPNKDKVPVIKVVREVTGLGIREAKELVESAPKAVIKEGMSKADAEALIAKLKDVGGMCELK